MNKLELTNTQHQGLKVGIKSDGRKYSVRDNRDRYFFPEEWIKFFNEIKKEKQPVFDMLINTGARIDEALNTKPEHFDFDRKTLTLYVTKVKARKNERVGKPRTFKISTEFSNRMKRYIRETKIEEGELLFKITQTAVYKMLRRKLSKAEFKDAWNFGLHNIRKTHGNYLKAMEVPAEEICLRLGHDYNTYLKHYGSATIFDRKDKVLMIKILGDLYGFK